MPETFDPVTFGPAVNLVDPEPYEASIPDYGPLVLDSYGNWVPVDGDDSDPLLYWRLALFILIALLLAYLAWRINQS